MTESAAPVNAISGESGGVKNVATFDPLMGMISRLKTGGKKLRDITGNVGKNIKRNKPNEVSRGV